MSLHSPHMPLKKKVTKKKATPVPKVYKDVTYKNSLEAYCARCLDDAGLPVNYESWKVVLHEKLQSQVVSWEPKTAKNPNTKFKIRTYGPVSQNLRTQVYTPDFVDLAQGWVIETKGLRTEAFNARWRSFKQWLHHNNLHHFRLYMPGNHQEIHETIAHILSTNHAR